MSVTACGADQVTTVGAAPDAAIAGPQGAVGQFAVECDFDHFGPDDPIVHPGHPGASHLHQFFGAVGVDAESLAGDLVSGRTTCDQQGDTAAYWAPALIGASGADRTDPVGRLLPRRAPRRPGAASSRIRPG